MKTVGKAARLAGVGYDIRGPVLDLAQRMEAAGQRIIKLNIGNLAAFNVQPPAAVVQAMSRNLPSAAGYTDSKGLLAPREAVVQECRRVGIAGVEVDDVYLGNGVSDLIQLALSAMLDPGDEVLLPAPNYPLYTAVVTLCGGNAVHYRCDPDHGWQPDLADLAARITPRCKALVVINPNNPTGVLYGREVLEGMVALARAHGLVLIADEIYDQTLYDGAQHTALGSLSGEVLCLTLNGLSKNHRACGYRAGWMAVSGDRSRARDYIEGLDMLASMRLCANTPGQLAICSALADRSSVQELVGEGGRLRQQRDLAFSMLSAIPGVKLVKPQAALYCFVGLNPAVYPVDNDVQLARELLEHEQVLVVQGSGFHWPRSDHFRITFLPQADELQEALTRIARFLARLRA